MKQHQDFILQPATLAQAEPIWDIIAQAIERRRQDGSDQWQNGYPNPEIIRQDIERGHGFVLTKDGEIAVYGALLFNDEPAYDSIDGQWLTAGDYLVVHRVAVEGRFHGQGLVQAFFAAAEDYARQHGVFSVKVDTNFDNGPMLHILQRLGYSYCGEVFLAGAPRKAFEKVLQP